MRRRSRWLVRTLGAVAFLAVLATAGGIFAYPALAAPVCPACYGLTRLGPNLVVEASMPPAQRAQLQADAEAAQSIVRAFYGAFDYQPVLVACATEACDHRLGGRGARATTLSTPIATVVRLSPRGLNTIILAHEFSHVVLHRRIGVLRQITGALPAWFDEGLAVLVSNDDRYVHPGATAQERCLRPAEVALPTNPFEWAQRSGKDPMLYADAACRVLVWMEAHGGREGLLHAIDRVAAGHGSIP